jgi:integrase
MARERRTRRQVSVAAMRRGEITGQKWDDVDFSQYVLFVTRSKTPEGESREIPLTERLLAFLLKRRWPEGHVIDFHGRPVCIVKRAWRSALKNARIRHLSSRHTFDTRLMEAGVLQEIRMALMGTPQAPPFIPFIPIPSCRPSASIWKFEQWVNDQRK